MLTKQQTPTRSQLLLGMQVAGLGLGSVDYVKDTITLDDRAAAIFDLPAKLPIARDTLHAQIHPDDRPDVEDEVLGMLAPDSEHFIDVQHRILLKSGKTRWVNARKQIMMSEDGQTPVSGIVAILDITETKESEARIAYLMREVAHRAKNQLSIVNSIARMTARHGDPETFITRFNGRIKALASNQATLVEDVWESMTIGRLVNAQLSPFYPADRSRMIIEGPKFEINADAAQAIGMALHELATNATKYGALSNPAGGVKVHWSVSKDEFTITWKESGGPAVEPPSSNGFGTKVIDTMAARALNGQVCLSYDVKGVVWSLSAPISKVAETL